MVQGEGAPLPLSARHAAFEVIASAAMFNCVHSGLSKDEKRAPLGSGAHPGSTYLVVEPWPEFCAGVCVPCPAVEGGALLLWLGWLDGAFCVALGWRLLWPTVDWF